MKGRVPGDRSMPSSLIKELARFFFTPTFSVAYAVNMNVCAWVHACMHVCCVHVCVCMHASMCMCACIHACMCVHVCADLPALHDCVAQKPSMTALGKTPDRCE